jgi:hypothetical protein
MFLLSSCDKFSEDDTLSQVDYEPQVVVEGSIENGQPATVMLSWSALFDEHLDEDFVLNHVIRSAKVSVSDGETTEVLTLGMDWSHLPPYVYYGTELLGEVGKSYQLTVEYQDKIITAETLIPQATPLTDFQFIKNNPTDSIGYLHITFDNTSDLYYQAATRVEEEESIYTPCLYGNFDAGTLPRDTPVSIRISKGPMVYPKPEFATYFVEGDVVSLKFRTMTQQGFDFWESWQNSVINGQNPIFPAITSLKSNIEGGIGIWCGYGTYTYRVETSPKNF